MLATRNPVVGEFMRAFLRIDCRFVSKNAAVPTCRDRRQALIMAFPLGEVRGSASHREMATTHSLVDRAPTPLQRGGLHHHADYRQAEKDNR
jgi:hypothetical protein